jgi:hypothetical protein
LKVKKVLAVRFLYNSLRHKTFAVCLLAAVVLPFSNHYQSEYAAVLTIVHPGVALRRANTQAWLTLQPGAVMPIGSGDSLQTDSSGRAWIQFQDDARTLLLTHSQLELQQFAIVDDQLQLSARLAGAAVHQMPTAIADFHLRLTTAEIVQPAAEFATLVRFPRSRLCDGRPG